VVTKGTTQATTQVKARPRQAAKEEDMPKETRNSGGRTVELITIDEYNPMRYDKTWCPECEKRGETINVVPKTKAGSYESSSSSSGRVDGAVHHFEHEPGTLSTSKVAANCPNNHLNKGKITEVWALVKANINTTFKKA